MNAPTPIHFKTRAQWRAWLSKHHDKTAAVWLLYYKKHTGKPTVPYNDAVEEALCFGWIDGKLLRIDDEKHMQRFTPRRPKSNWSESNRKRVARMIKAGRMTPAGMALVRAAKKSGAWKKAGDTHERVMHPEFEAALKRDKKARDFFDSLAPSYRKHYLWWIADAKRADTRNRRIAKTMEMLRNHRKPGMS